MITQERVVEKILDYLNGHIDRYMLVYWAEDALFALSESDYDVPGEKTLMEVLGYIGAGDSAGFPLTWDVLSAFLAQLGVTVRVVAVPAA
ncbi:MAG: hypothetical protein JXB47_01845 [Anaerolineae bacterium]|nr:hypothetical protein [Anaerolineae bacterium]